MAKRTSKARTTLYATVATFVLAVLIPWSCKLDTRPLHPGKPAPPTEDNDSGETK